MSDDSLRVYTWIGLCLLCVQQAEGALQTAIDTILDDPKVRLFEQSEAKRKNTLGDILKKLKRRVRLPPNIKNKLYHFLRMRNQLVHELNSNPDWDMGTEQGRKALLEFVAELTIASLAFTVLFATIYQVWARDKFDQEFFEVEEEQRRLILKTFEKQFGSMARSILAGKNPQPFSQPGNEKRLVPKT